MARPPTCEDCGKLMGIKDWVEYFVNLAPDDYTVRWRCGCGPNPGIWIWKEQR